MPQVRRFLINLRICGIFFGALGTIIKPPAFLKQCNPFNAAASQIFDQSANLRHFLFLL